MQKWVIGSWVLLFSLVMGVFTERYVNLSKRVRAVEQEPAPSTATSRRSDDELFNALANLKFEIQKVRRDLAAAAPASGGGANLKDVMDRLDEMSSELYDFEKQTQQNLMIMNTNVLRRIADLQQALSPQKIDPENLAKQLAQNEINFDPAKNTVSFKVRPILRERPLEVIVVNDGGPGHESLFRSNAKPSLVRLALLAMGLESGSKEPKAQGVGPQGSQVTMYISWPGLAKPHRLEEAILDIRTGKPMPNAKWVFAGSEFVMDFRTGRECYIPDDARVVIGLTLNFSETSVIACSQDEIGNEQVWAPNSEIFPDRPDAEVTLTIAKEPIADYEGPRASESKDK